MRRHLLNAGWGVVDYAAYPFGMLLVAPIVLHRLGAAQYGVWTVSTAVVSVGGVIASGFGDANIQRVARLRGHSDHTQARNAMLATVRSLLTIHLLLGILLSTAAWCGAPFAARHLAHGDAALTKQSVVALHIAAVLILVRALETVPVSTQRAFEQFGSTVRINTGVRLVTLATAAGLAFAGHSVLALLFGTALFLLLGTFLQFQELRRLLGAQALLPTFNGDHIRTLLHSGLFTWIQALGSVIFGQLDRVVLGISLGAAAVAPYTLCVQFAHPIYGLTGSALAFLFPYLSARAGTVPRRELVRTLSKALLCNVTLVAIGAGSLLVAGPWLIRAWAGPAVAQSASPILPVVVLGSSLMGIGVTATCALLALGAFRLVAVVSLASRAVMLLVMAMLVHHHGLVALAFVRVGYGIFAVSLYPLLWHALRAPRAVSSTAQSTRVVMETPDVLLEGAQL